MYIQWHETKRLKNLREHGVDFAGLTTFFDGQLLTQEDVRYDYPEPRFQSIGVHKGVVLFVVWTPVGTDGTTTHLISARRATHHETQTWFRHYSTYH
jgi:hypothetical protein